MNDYYDREKEIENHSYSLELYTTHELLPSKFIIWNLNKFRFR